LQCVAACCSVLQCVAVCCSVLTPIFLTFSFSLSLSLSLSQLKNTERWLASEDGSYDTVKALADVARSVACCSLLQSVATCFTVCCSVLQFVLQSVCCRVLQCVLPTVQSSTCIYTCVCIYTYIYMYIHMSTNSTK